MPTLPALEKNVNHSPHVIILGAGASLAAFPNGDVNGKKLPLMNSIIDTLGLSSLLNEQGIDYTNKGFEELYSELSLNKKYNKIREIIEEEIYQYFHNMQITDKPTLYDYLVLSLREKDLIATFNWDPLLLQAYIRNKNVKKLPQIVFLHGNTAVGYCNNCKILGNMDNRVCHKCFKTFSKMKLLYPVNTKKYNIDPVIEDQWALLREKLNYAYLLTIYGYSAPVTDIDAKNLMLEVWKENKTLELAQVEIIDIKQERKLRKTWNDFLFSHHYNIIESIEHSCLWNHPRRSCDAFAAANLQCTPWPDNKYPKFKSIDDLHDWLKPLLEEKRFEETKIPFHIKRNEAPCSRAAEYND